MNIHFTVTQIYHSVMSAKTPDHDLWSVTLLCRVTVCRESETPVCCW